MIARLIPLLIACALTVPAFADEAEDALVERGVAAYDEGEYEKAKGILLPLAEAGHPKAMNMIGLMHEMGAGYPENITLGCDWYERSAQAGYVSAQGNLAICYRWGNGRKKNMEEFLFWSQKAAQEGNKKSQLALAGYYVDRDREEYLYWAQKAASQGSILTKALMWGNGDKDLVPDLHWTDIVCTVVMIGWLDKRYDYCD